VVIDIFLFIWGVINGRNMDVMFRCDSILPEASGFTLRIEDEIAVARLLLSPATNFPELQLPMLYPDWLKIFGRERM
jgi:hypothetical protein